MAGFILKILISFHLIPIDTFLGTIKFIDIDHTNDSVKWVLTREEKGHPIVYKDGKEYKRFPFSIITPDTSIVWIENKTGSVLGLTVYFADRYGNKYKEVPLADLLRPYYENGYTYIGRIDGPFTTENSPIDTIWGRLSDAGGAAIDTQFIGLGLTFLDTGYIDEKDEWGGGFEKEWWADIVHMRIYEDTTYPLNRAVCDGVKRYGDSLYVLTRDLHLHKHIVNTDGSLTEVYDIATPYTQDTEALKEPDCIKMELSLNGKYINVGNPLDVPSTFTLYYATDGELIGYFTEDSFSNANTGYNKKLGIDFYFPNMDAIRGGVIFGGSTVSGPHKIFYYCIDSMKVLNSYETPDIHWTISDAHPLDSYGREMIVVVRSQADRDSMYVFHVDSTGQANLLFSWYKKGYLGGAIQTFHRDTVQYLVMMLKDNSILYRVVR